VYNDLKYIRYLPTFIHLPNFGSSVVIPLLTAFQEAAIIEMMFKISSTTLDLKDPKTSAYFLLILSVCEIQYNEKWTAEDLLAIYIGINNEIIKPFLEFQSDQDVKKLLGDPGKQSNDESKYSKFSLIQLATTVLSRLNLPPSYEKYFGLRACIIANKILNDMDDASRVHWIPLLAEVGNMANCYVDRKKAKPFDHIIKDYNKRMGIKACKVSSGLAGIMGIISEVESSGQSMSNKEYIEQMRSKYKDQSNNAKNN
jgi:hypothetical protein